MSVALFAKLRKLHDEMATMRNKREREEGERKRSERSKEYESKARIKFC